MKSANDDDKHAKFNSNLVSSPTSISTRRLIFYIFFITLLADVVASQAEVLNHLTLWSHILHTLYFELNLDSSFTMIRLLHGPSFCGSHALLVMYLWTLLVNPSMEFDLAPEGRAEWLIYARGIWIHFMAVLCHWADLSANRIILKKAYQNWNQSRLFQFWVSVGGYFAMGLTWEQVNGDAAGTYNVTLVSPEVFVMVTKVLGVLGCVVAYMIFIKPKLMS